MKACTLQRDHSTLEGTFGLLRTDDHSLVLHTLELPWVDKDKDGIGDSQHSCINTGTYTLTWHQSPSKGWCYLVNEVVGRSNILVHSANFAGDVDAGWESQLLGCIALGRNIGVMKNSKGKAQKAITQSRDACKLFYDWGEKESIRLTIT